MRRLDLAGRDVSERLLTLLRKSGASLFATSSERQAVRRMKERIAYIAVDPAQEERRVLANDRTLFTSFDLPDGNVVEVGAERFRAPEILFRPDIIGHEFGGVADAVTSAISAADIGLRRNYYSSILLAVRVLVLLFSVLFSVLLTCGCG